MDTVFMYYFEMAEKKTFYLLILNYVESIFSILRILMIIIISIIQSLIELVINIDMRTYILKNHKKNVSPMCLTSQHQPN